MNEAFIPMLHDRGPCRKAAQVFGLMEDGRGGFSGGTLASGFNQAEAEDPKDLAAFTKDKYYLLPADAK